MYNVQDERAAVYFQLNFCCNTRLIPFSPLQLNYLQNTRQFSKSKRRTYCYSVMISFSKRPPYHQRPDASFSSLRTLIMHQVPRHSLSQCVINVHTLVLDEIHSLFSYVQCKRIILSPAFLSGIKHYCL